MNMSSWKSGGNMWCKVLFTQSENTSWSRVLVMVTVFSPYVSEACVNSASVWTIAKGTPPSHALIQQQENVSISANC